MKLNPRNPRHVLVFFGLQLIQLVVVIKKYATTSKSTTKKCVILFGHKLNGNLLPIYDELSANNTEVYFLTINKSYYKTLSDRGVDVLYALKLRDMIKVASSAVIISTHGVKLIRPVVKHYKNYLIDVWHGIPYKGFDQDDFRHIYDFDEIWVTSKFMKKLYIKKFGFRENQVIEMGYSRVNRLLNLVSDGSRIKDGYNLGNFDKLVLFAPTWNQDLEARDILPRGIDMGDFFNQIDKIMKRNNACLIVRTHLNSGDDYTNHELANVKFMPYSTNEDTEEFLAISDALITDWSSIAFDYLPLKRPTLFMDVQPPFAKGFTLDESYRFGTVINSLHQATDLLEDIVTGNYESLVDMNVYDGLVAKLYGSEDSIDKTIANQAKRIEKILKEY